MSHQVSSFKNTKLFVKKIPNLSFIFPMTINYVIFFFNVLLLIYYMGIVPGAMRKIKIEYLEDYYRYVSLIIPNFLIFIFIIKTLKIILNIMSGDLFFIFYLFFDKIFKKVKSLFFYF